MSGGRLVLRAQGYPLAGHPAFDVDATLRGLNLAELKTVIRKVAGVEVKRGMLDVYVEAAAKSATLQGYAKPIFERLEVERSNRGVAAAVKGAGVKAATKLLRQGPERRIATRVELGGSLGHPNVDVVGAVGELIRNAFLKPLGANLENRLHLSPGKGADEASVHYVRPGRSRSWAALILIADATRRWAHDEVPRMAAALSYYTAFSLAPLLILVIAIAGFAFGRDAAQGRIMNEIGGVVGHQSAAAIQSMIQSAQKPAHGIVATIISVVGLFLGASGVLSELKFALNRIFRTEERGGVGELVKQRLKLLGLILGIGFLLTVSLAVSAAVSAAGKFMGGALPLPEVVMHALNFVISFVVVTALFGLMYKFVPDIRMRWRDIWIGAGLTSFLFTVGKIVLGIYLGKGAVASSYGAAGSVLIILLWVYYSALIFYFGAEFTHVYAERYGVKPQPEQALRRELSRAA
jgi:membrane protein